jgi:hypothetical protein
LTRASAILNCQLALAWCLLRWLCHATEIQKLPSFSMTGATRLSDEALTSHRACAVGCRNPYEHAIHEIFS